MKQSHKYYIHPIYFLLYVVILFLLGGLFYNWSLIKTTFFNVRITEIIQICITIFIAVYITKFVNKRISNETKQKEIFAEQFSKFEILLASLFKFGNDYMNSPTDELGHKITNGFRDAGLILSIIKELHDMHKIPETHLINFEEIKTKFIRVKKSLTDSPFKEKNKKYTQAQIQGFNISYNELAALLVKNRFRLYSN